MLDLFCFILEMEQLPPPPTAAPAIPYEAAAQVVAAFPTARMRTRADGWTAERQRAFCEALADCGLVRDAAAAVGMTAQSAYRLKRRAEGKGFALAWAAALLLARQRLIDLAIERAMDGNSDAYFKDGELVGERRKKDVRHLLAAITKLENAQSGHVLIDAIADEFDEFLDCMEAEVHTRQAEPEETGGKGRGKKPVSPVQQFFESREGSGGLDWQDCEKLIGRLGRQRLQAERKASRDKGKADSDDLDDLWGEGPLEYELW
jgi:hypothetical protein